MTDLNATATRAAEILRLTAQDFRAGNLDRAHRHMWGAMDFLGRAGEGAFGQRITALEYMFDMPAEVPATVCERIAAEVDALVDSGFIGNRA